MASGESCKRPWLVANRATVPQKWPPPPRNVADSCELTETTKLTENPIFQALYACLTLERPEALALTENVYEP